MRPAQLKTIRKIAKFLDTAQLKYAVIGGIAVAIYGIPRFTMDVDVNVVVQKDDIADFIKKARKSGFRPLVANDLEFAVRTGVIPMKLPAGSLFERCDFIIAQNALEHLAIERASTMTVGGCRFRVISAEDLFLHKIVSDRPIDREDARGIVARQKRLDLRYVNSWIKKISALTGSKQIIKKAKLVLAGKA